MSLPLEDYALIGDTYTAGLVSLRGSIDWLCLPRFDSGACFAALLGDVDHGSWELAPEGQSRATRRRYRRRHARPRNRHRTAEGEVRVRTSCRPVTARRASCARSRGSVAPFRCGRPSPALRLRLGGSLVATGAAPYHRGRRSRCGRAHSDVPLDASRRIVSSRFVVQAGDRLAFTLTWHPSHQPADRPDRRVGGPARAPCASGPRGRLDAPTKASGASRSCAR